MYKFNLKLLLNNRILLVWPLTAIVAPVIIGLTADAQSAVTGYSFLSGIFIFIAVISIPAILDKHLDSEQAALLFSKPISRSEFFLAEFGAVLTITFLYSLLSAVTFSVLYLIGTGAFPFQFFLAVLIFTPLSFIILYIPIVLLLIFTDSFLASVLIGYIAVPVVTLFLMKNELFLTMIGWDTGFLLGLADVFSYLIPSASGMSLISQNAINSGFANFDWQLFGFVMVSCVPFFLLSYYLMLKKEF